MMKSLEFAIVCLLVTGGLPLVVAGAEEFRAENLIANGDFRSGEDYPLWWELKGSGVVYSRTQGKDGKPMFGVRGGANVRQIGLMLVAGRKYKLSGFAKTSKFVGKNGKTARGGVVVINDGWNAEVGFHPSKANSDWAYFEKVIKMPKTRSHHMVVIYSQSESGQLLLSDLKLQSSSEDGSDERAAWHYLDRMNVYPLCDTRRISSKKPRLVLGFPYLRNEGKEAQYHCRVSVKGSTVRGTGPIQDGKVAVQLKGVSPGAHVVNAEIVGVQTGDVLCSAEIPVTVIEPVKLNMAGSKRLNNLVTRLQHKTIDLAAATVSECRFANPRHGWVFVQITPSSPRDGIRISLPGAKGADVVQRENSTASVEAFRLFPMGEQKVLISAKQPCKVRLTINSIPEILYDAPNYSPWKVKIPALGKSSWPFIEKHLLGSYNGFIRGSLSTSELAQCKKRGLRWMSNETTSKIKNRYLGPLNQADAAAYLAGMKGFKDPKYDGVCADEFIFGSVLPRTFAEYARALDRMYTETKCTKPFYSWIAGHGPVTDVFFGDFLSSAVQRDGKTMFEAYCLTQPTREEAENHIDATIVRTMRALKRAYPNAQEHTLFGLGVFTQMFSLNEFFHPGVDHKHFLDMQMNVLANHPELDGLYGLAIWSSGYSDEQTLRWVARLFRHYAVEGSKEMLSAKYGYKYRPGHLDNGDFLTDMKGWTLVPAEKGTITRASHKGYGNLQGRWANGKVGDTFAVLRRSGKGPNILSQTIRNLVPGKLYYVQYILADRAGLSGGASKRQIAFSAQLGSAVVIPEKSFDYLHKPGRAKGKSMIYPAWRRIVFRATAPTAKLILSDWKTSTNASGPVGQEIMLSFVQCLPYFGN